MNACEQVVCFSPSRFCYSSPHNHMRVQNCSPDFGTIIIVSIHEQSSLGISDPSRPKYAEGHVYHDKTTVFLAWSTQSFTGLNYCVQCKCLHPARQETEASSLIVEGLPSQHGQKRVWIGWALNYWRGHLAFYGKSGLGWSLLYPAHSNAANKSSGHWASSEPHHPTYLEQNCSSDFALNLNHTCACLWFVTVPGYM